MRTRDADVVMRATAQVEDLKGQPVSDWLALEDNVALTNSHGDVALFEKRGQSVYCGHYFFHSRGKTAVNSARDFLDEFFRSYGTIVIGLTPTDKKGAIWLTRHLGFSVTDFEKIDGKEHMVSVMTRKQWNEQPSRR